MTEETNNVVQANDTTKLNMDWRDNIKTVAPEYVSEWDEFKNSDSPEKFFKQLADHRSMLGRSVRIPSEDAGEEQMNEFYNKIQTKVSGLMRTPDPDDDEAINNVLHQLGKPEAADSYRTNAEFDSEELGALRQHAFDAGLTAKQFSKFSEKYYERISQAREKQSDTAKADIDSLKGEWGNAFEQRSKLAANIAEKTGAPPQLVEAIGKGVVDSATLKWLFSLGEQFGSETNNFGVDDGQAIDTPAEVDAQIDDIMNNAAHPYWNNSHPAHKKAVDRMLDLQRKKAG